VPGLTVQVDAGALVGTLGPLVGEQEGLLDRRDDDLERDVPLTLQQPQCGHVDVHQSS